MKMPHPSPILSCIVTLLALGFAPPIARGQDAESAAKAAEEAGRLREALRLYTQALQSAPESSVQDQVYREIIIGLALRIDPPPAVPDEVISFEGRAEAALKSAKSTQDYLDAAREYRKALRAAPWLASDYFNLAVVLEKAGQTVESIRQFKLYLRAAPGANDAIDVKKKIAGLEYEMEKAASSRAREEERQRAETTARYAAEQQRLGAARNIAGYWKGPGAYHFLHYRIDVVGNQFELFLIRDDGSYGNPPDRILSLKMAYGTILNGEIQGHVICTTNATFTMNGVKATQLPGNYPIIQPCVVSPDGNLELKCSIRTTRPGVHTDFRIGPLVRE